MNLWMPCIPEPSSLLSNLPPPILLSAMASNTASHNIVCVQAVCPSVYNSSADPHIDMIVT